MAEQLLIFVRTKLQNIASRELSTLGTKNINWVVTTRFTGTWHECIQHRTYFHFRCRRGTINQWICSGAGKVKIRVPVLEILSTIWTSPICELISWKVILRRCFLFQYLKAQVSKWNYETIQKAVMQDKFITVNNIELLIYRYDSDNIHIVSESFMVSVVKSTT